MNEIVTFDRANRIHRPMASLFFSLIRDARDFMCKFW
jgi:hypothetical protein